MYNAPVQGKGDKSGQQESIGSALKPASPIPSNTGNQDRSKETLKGAQKF